MFGRSKVTTITPGQAHEGLRAGTLRLVDVREPAELALGRVKGAANVPLGTLDPAALGAGPPVAFLCRSGARSGRAARQAAKAGLTVMNVGGGMLAWERDGLPVTRGR